MWPSYIQKPIFWTPKPFFKMDVWWPSSPMRQPKAPGGGKWRVPTARGAAWNQNHRCHNCVIIKIIIIIRGAAWNRHQNYHCHHHHHHAGICQMYIFGHHSHHWLLSSVIPEECRPTKAKVGMVIQEPDINIIDSYTYVFFFLARYVFSATYSDISHIKRIHKYVQNVFISIQAQFCLLTNVHFKYVLRWYLPNYFQYVVLGLFHWDTPI